jgi:chromosome segregation ATPase
MASSPPYSSSNQAINNLQQQLQENWFLEEQSYDDKQNLTSFSSSTRNVRRGNDLENDERHHPDHDISSLANNLTSQTEYNNELLTYISHLELKIQEYYSENEKLINSNNNLNKEISNLNERNNDLLNKLTISSSLCDELASQFHHLRQEILKTEQINKENKIEYESLLQKYQYLDEQNTIKSQQLLLQSSTHQRRGRRSSGRGNDDDENNQSDENDEEERNENHKNELLHLQYQLSILEQELETSHQKVSEVTLHCNNLTNEKIQMESLIEYYLKQHEEDMMQRDKAVYKCKEMSNLLSKEQTEKLNLLNEKDQLMQRNEMLGIRLQDQMMSRQEAVEYSKETDLKWRELEVSLMMGRAGEGRGGRGGGRR